MLNFKTKADLDSAIVLVNKTKDDTKWVNQQFPLHISHNSVFNALTKEELRLLDSSTIIPEKYKDIVKFVEFDSSRILVESVSIHPFSIFSNKDGILGIGNEVIKISSNYIYSMNKDYYSANLNLDYTKLSSSNENVKMSSVNNSIKFRANQYMGVTQLISEYGGARRMAIYLWKQQYLMGNSGSTFQQVDCWGQYENFGCDGWFCSSTWRPDWCYSMDMTGSVSVDQIIPSTGANYPLKFYISTSIGPVNGPNLVAQVHVYESFGTYANITNASVQLNCKDGNGHLQGLYYNY